MFYEYTLKVPAGTTEASPVEAEAPLAPGTITQVAVQFLAGCVAEVHISIWRSEHQVWPGNLDGDIAGENGTVGWVEGYDLEDEPYSFTIKGWAPNATYDHTVHIRFALLPLEVGKAAGESLSLLQRIVRGLLGG